MMEREEGMGQNLLPETEIRLANVGSRILAQSRNELYLHMRYLDVALSAFEYVMDSGIDTVGTDGRGIYFHPAYLGGLYRDNRILVNRAYLHMVLHCIFRHLIRRNGREKELWDLACDIAAESMADSMHYRSVRQSVPWLRRDTYRKLKKKMKVLAPEKIYGVLLQWKQTEWEGQGKEFSRLTEEFYVDSHDYWPSEDDKKRQTEIENRWKDMSDRMETELETGAKEASSGSGDLLEQVKVENRERFDYRTFLRKFSVLKEEMTVDDDSFDYIFYSYGLSLYGNMPLLEPQEWKEVQKVEEFAVVIDTSMSCSGEMVQKFLEETYSVLGENESFFRKVNIHIIQCDDEVKADYKITSAKELRDYMEHFELAGDGGTDFRPAFAYVDELIRDSAFEQLRGLLYFTDGYGIFPEKKPPYETAFVFIKEDYEEVQVPPWSLKLMIEAEELTDSGEEGVTGWI